MADVLNDAPRATVRAGFRRAEDRRAQRVLAAAAAVAAADSEQELVRCAVTLARAAIDARCALALLTGPDGEPAVLAQHRPNAAHAGDTALAPLSGPAGPLAAVLGGAVLRIADLTDLAGGLSWAGLPDESGPVTALLGVPLRHGGQVLGGLYLMRDADAGPFGAADEAAAAVAAALTAAALDGLRQRQAASHLLDSLALLEARATDVLPASSITTATRASAVVRRLVSAARSLLGMQLTFLSTIDGDHQTFLAVDATSGAPQIAEGSTIAAAAGYCQLLLDERIPAAVPNIPAHPLLGRLPVTAAVGAGAYCGVPVRRADGSTFGTLCGLNADPGQPPTAAQMQALTTIAGLIGQRLDLETEQATRHARRRTALLDLIDGARSTIVVQPIVDLADGSLVGHEALARFSDPNGALLPPDGVFAEAHRLGLAVHVELAAARAALSLLPQLPAGTYLSINFSPTTLLDPAAANLLAPAPADRVVVEITEHEAVPDYPALRDRLAPLRARGLRLAVDDTGAGSASLHHLVQLAPDVIKLDAAFVRDIDADPARRAITRAIAGYATEIGATLIAEGIQTPPEAAALRALGAHLGQGYLYGRPGPLLPSPRPGLLIA